MQQLMGIINLDHELDQLNELTYFRCGAAVPFAGRYRLIDFVLSNMVHAQINDIALFVRRKYRSLLDHLGEGKPWDLAHKRGGLFVLPPDWHDPTDTSRGDLQHFHNNMDFFHRGSANYIVHTGSQHICTIDFQDVFRYHQQQGADVTLVYTKVPQLEEQHASCIRLEIDEETGQVHNIHHELNHPNVYMETFIIEKSLFIELVQRCIAHGQSFFFRDAIQRNKQNLKIAAYEYTGYHAIINSVQSYYRTSLDLLNQENYQQLFKPKMIHTKIKYEPPARYLGHAQVSNSLISNGCVIEGIVENSILFRGVKVHKGAIIKNAIIMQKCEIDSNTLLENVIMDKEVHITSNRMLIGDVKKPFMIAKRHVL